MKEKRDSVKDYCQENEIAIICIQETWLQQNIDLTFKGYNFIRKNRSEGTKGGVLI